MNLIFFVLLYCLDGQRIIADRKWRNRDDLIGQPIRRSVRGNGLFVDPTELIRLPTRNIQLEPNIIHSCYKRIDPRTCSEWFNKMLDY